MKIDDEIRLNQYAQGIGTASELTEWFESKSDECQVAILRQLVFFAFQSGVDSEVAKEALKQSGLRLTFTPCVLLQNGVEKEDSGIRGSLRQAAAQIINLPADERGKSFALLLELFRLAAARNRTERYNHQKWWHQDLSDEAVIRNIRSKIADSY